MANESLGKAKSRKNDEFYTVYDYIQKEMNAYLEYDPNVFRGKISMTAGFPSLKNPSALWLPAPASVFPRPPPL